MGDPPAKSRLPAILQAAVQSVRWTYSLFWQFCPQQGVLVWRDGYYNGPIKTRKTVQPTEVSTEEATLQRSQQLRELYECLSSAGHQPQRPSAALSPEDLTESEWFYLICVSFSFTPGLGLPGKAYVKRNHIWLTRADEADTKFFSRAILAKSARIQTVVCFPLLDGVVELGTIEKVEENIDLIQRVKSFFKDCRNPNPRPAVSQNSTSNPPTSTSPTAGFQSPVIYAPPHNVLAEEEEKEEEEDEVRSDSDFEDQVYVTHDTIDHEAMQLDIYVDTKLGSPHDSSNNLDSDFHHLAVSRLGSSSEHRWPLKHPTLLTPRLSGILSPDVLALDDTNYSRTLGNILQSQCSASPSTAMSSATSAFRHWSSSINHTPFRRGASQWTLKYILFTVPHLPTKHGWFPHDDLGGSHVLAERRRREKLNERFVVLRSLVPFVTKMDKASILGDTIEYLKQLRRRIKELESERSPVGREKQKAKVVESPVEVSIIENDALVEIECVHREGLLLDAMQVLGDLGIKVITVQSSIHDGVFAAHFRAKVQLGNVSGRKPSIMEVKRSINRIIRHQ